MTNQEAAEKVIEAHGPSKIEVWEASRRLATAVQRGELVGWVPVEQMPDEWRDGRPLLFVGRNRDHALGCMDEGDVDVGVEPCWAIDVGALEAFTDSELKARFVHVMQIPGVPGRESGE